MTPDARAKAIGDWSFDPDAAEYVNARTGARQSLGDQRAVLDAHVDAVRVRMQQHAASLVDGRLTPDQFEARMRTDIRALHIQARILGAGGRDQMTQSEWGKTGYKLRGEYRYLNAFVRDIEAGRMSPAGIIDRAGKYAGSSAVDQFEEARRGAQKRAGYTEKRRIAANDAGTCSTCRAEAARGWVPIDEPGFRIGHTQCQSRDRCTIEYRRASGVSGDAAPVIGGRAGLSDSDADEWGEAFHGRYVDGLPAGDVQRIADYKTLAYREVNAALRSGERMGKDDAAVADVLDRAISGAPVLKGELTLFRGLSDEAIATLGGLRPGTTFSDKAFVSTSLNPNAASLFANEEEGGVFVRIRAPVGTRGLYADTGRVRREGRTQNEREFILPRGSRFRVVGSGDSLSDKYGGTVPVIDVEVVP